MTIRYDQNGKQVIRTFHGGYRVSWKRRGRELGGGELFELELEGPGEARTRALLMDVTLGVGALGTWYSPAESLPNHGRITGWNRTKGLRVVVSFITALSDGDAAWELMERVSRELVLR